MNFPLKTYGMTRLPEQILVDGMAESQDPYCGPS